MEENYQKLIKSIEFSANRIIHVNTEKTDYVVEGVRKKSKVLLKTSLDLDLPKIEGYNRELLSENIISILENKGKIALLARTEVIETGKDFGFVWILRQYIEGDSLIDFSKLRRTRLFGYENIALKYSREQDWILPKVVKLIKTLNQIKPNMVEKYHDRDKLHPRFSFELNNDNIQLVNKSTNDQIQKAVEYYQKNRLAYSDKEKFVGCFGDMLPPNIIIKDKEILLSDFEWFSFDSYMVDIAMLWLFLTKFPKWQSKLIRLSIVNHVDEEYFKMSIIRIVINCIWHNRFKTLNGQPFVWYRYLTNICDDKYLLSQE